MTKHFIPARASFRGIPLLLFFSIVFSNSSHSSEQGQYSIDSKPDWVRPAAAFAPSPPGRKGAFDGSRTLLRDFQYNAIDRSQVSRYVAIEYELLSRGSVEDNSTITIDFDPSYEELIVHGISINRDGMIIDKIKSARKEVLQTEQDLFNLIYDGTLTFTAILSDIRKGDIVRYEYSVLGSNPIYGDNFERYFSTASYQYSHHNHYRILTFSGDDLNLRYKSGTTEYEENSKNAPPPAPSVPGLVITSYPTHREYLYSKHAVSDLDWENRTPRWRSPRSGFSVSDMNSWNDVAVWAFPLYEQAIQTTPELIDTAKYIADNYQGSEAKIGAALAWVQSEIRYFGIELGANSHQPSTAEETLERRYGDCKDKTVLLISLLKELEIEAEAALVNTQGTLRASDAVKRMHAFNHVIVHVYIDGESHWLDPTRTYQKGKLGNLSEPDFGAALIVHPDTTALTQMASPHSLTISQFHSFLTFDPQDSSFAKLKVETIRNGRSAEKHRSYVSENGIEEVTEVYEEYYQDIYPELESVSKIELLELSGNVTSTTEYYDIHNFWENTDRAKHLLKAEDLRDWMIAPSNPRQRKYAYKLPDPAQISEYWNINFNQEISDYYTSDSIETPEFNFTVEMRQSADSQSLAISYYLEILTQEVSADRITVYTDAINEAWKWTSAYITPKGLKRSIQTLNDDTEIASSE